MSGFEIILIIVTSFIISGIAATTRGDGENLKNKIIIGTILGTIVLGVLRLM